MPISVYRSKVGWEILIPTTAILVTVIVLMIVHGVWVGLIICSLVFGLIVHIWTNTTYQITADRRLLIKCGVLEKLEVDIDEITSIRKSNEITSAPATSIDRLEINYSGGRVLISPREKEKFVKDLKALNPKIWWAA